jgi:O-antigen/teichoic acid export membrane protein
VNKNLLKNPVLSKFFAFSAGNWISLIVSLLSTPIITRILSPEEFGVFSLFTVVLNLLLIVSMLGTDQSYVRFFYEVGEQFQKILLQKCLVVAFGMFFLLSILIVAFNDYVGVLLFSRKDFSLIVLLIIGGFVSIINRFALLVVRMEQRGGLYSTLQVISKVLDFAFLMLIYLSGLGILKYNIPIISMIISYLIVSVMAVYHTKKHWTISFKDNFLKENPKLKELIYYGFPLSIALILTWLFQYIDRFFIEKLGNYKELGLYAAAFKLVSILNIIQASFTTFWVPLSNKKFQESKDNKQFFSDMFNLISFLMISLGFALIIFKDFLSLFFGRDFSGAIYIFPMLVFIPIMYTISEVSVVGINFYKKSKWQIIISLIVCIANIFGNILLIPYFGAKGAAISTGLSYILFMLLRTKIGRRYFNFNINKISLLTGVIMLVIYLQINTFIETNSYIRFLGITMLGLYLVFNREIIKRFLNGY